MEAGPLAAALGLAAVHPLAAGLGRVEAGARGRWLSFAGGIAVAYVFVRLLPELAAAQETLSRAARGPLASLERHAYLVALAGLALFYGVEHAAIRSRGGRGAERGAGRASFALGVASFAALNAVIGYVLVHRRDDGARSLALFATAMAVHFVVNDFGLRAHHRRAYDRIGRWVLAAAVPAGWAVGAATEISEPALALLLAFLAGGIVLNVLKEELPAERASRFPAFLAGAVPYAALLLAV